MAEEGLSPNSDWILVGKLSNDLIKLQTNFNNFVIEEKEKIVNLEKKNFLENQLEEMNKKIEKINFDHKNEIEEMKQNLKQKDDKISFLEEENKKIIADNENKIEENIKQLKNENDACFQQKDEKIKFLEEETNEKIQKINCDIENKIEETNQNLKKLIEENINQLKAENARKDEKINSLEVEIKKVELLEKKIGDLTIKLNNEIFKTVNFVGIKNKWKQIDSDYSKCCDNKCINTGKPVGNCIKGYGFVNLIDNENIKYMNCLEEKGGKLFRIFEVKIFLVCNKFVRVYAENSFTKPKNCLNYSLNYFEIKCKFVVDLQDCAKFLCICLNCSPNKRIEFNANSAAVYNGEAGKFKLLSFTWKDNDIFGFGLVYPPTNKMNYKFPYVFFTHNGKQIGKGILLKNNFDSCKAFVELKRCSVEANFGNNLEAKPFNYDISKHSVLKEFY